MPTVTIWQDGIKQKVDINDSGIIDETAKYVFRAGQCAALALAINKIAGWEIWGLFDITNKANSPGHVVVRHPATKSFIDIEGTGAFRRWRKDFGRLTKVQLTPQQVKRLYHYPYPSIRAAMPFAKRLIEETAPRNRCRNSTRRTQ